jgi:hypothetical protein
MQRRSIFSNIINTLCRLPFIRKLPGVIFQKTAFFKAAAVRTGAVRGHVASKLRLLMVRSPVWFTDHKKVLRPRNVNKYIRVENLFKVLRCM